MKRFLILLFLIFFVNIACAQAISVYSDNNKFGLKDDNGEIILKPTYKKLIRVGDGSFLVQNKRNKFGIIGLDGKEIVVPKYRHAERILGKYLVLGNYGDFGMYDQTGKNVIENKYDSLSLLFGNMMLTYKNYHCGVVDYQGNVLLDNVFNEIYMPDANTMMVKYENDWYKIEQVKADTLKQPEINDQINDKNFELVDIVETTGAVSGYSVVTFSDYLIKMISSISPSHEQTIDELMFSQGAETVNILIKFSWLPKYPFTYAKNYYRTVKNPYNGPFSTIKTKLKKHIK